MSKPLLVRFKGHEGDASESIQGLKVGSVYHVVGYDEPAAPAPLPRVLTDDGKTVALFHDEYDDVTNQE